MFLRRTLCIFLLCLTAGELLAERRALVIGNAAYASLDPLQNTLTDAEGYATAFGALGFDVTFLTDLDEEAMVDNVVSFVDGIAPGDEVAFVYAGHGWSADGINYLIPTDAPKSGSARQLSRRSLPLKNGVNGVLDDIAAQGASLSLAIIDACRDNPFAGNGTRSIGATRGLARLDPQQGSFVIYSAGEGQTALDRLALDGPEQKYSVFTRHFLPLLTSPMYLEDAVFAAQERTARAARSQDHMQIPAVYRQKLGKTCLVETCEAAPETVARPKPAAGPRKDWVYQIAFPRGTKGHIGFIAVHPERDDVAVLTSEYPEASEADPDAHTRDIRYFSGDGALMWQVEVANRAQVLAFEGDDLLVLGSNGIQWMDRATGRVSKVKNYAGRREVDLSSVARIGATRLRVFGDLRRGSVTTEDVVFDIDIAQARVSEPVFRSEDNLHGWSVRLAPDGRFIAEVPVAAAEPPDRPSANDGLHAPDGTVLRHVAIGDTPWTDWDISSQGYVSLSQVKIPQNETGDAKGALFEYWLEQVPWAGEPSRVLVARVDDVGFPLGVRSDGSDTITVLLMDERQSTVDIFQYDAAGLEPRTRSSFVPPEARMFGLPGAAFSDGGVLTVLYRHTFRKTTDGPPFVLTLVATGPPAARQP